MGQTVWGGRAGDGAAGLSWDWVELAEGIVAIADPMAITTNLRLLGADGEVLTIHSSAPHLNRLAHALAWQPEVLRAIAEADTEAAALRAKPGRKAAPRDRVAARAPALAG